MTYIRGLAIPCAGAADCDIIANHPSSNWLGIPVPIYGLVMYTALLALSTGRLAMPLRRPLFSKLGFGLSVLGMLISVFLTIYALQVIRASCRWCVFSAIVVTLLAICFSFLIFMGEEPAPVEGEEGAEGETDKAPVIKPDPLAYLAPAIGLVLALGLIGNSLRDLQARIDTAAAYIVLGGRTAIDLLPNEARVKGPRDAPITIIEFADPNCPTCRASQPRMEALMQKYPGKIRLGFRYAFSRGEVGSTSPLAAAISEYAASQGRFWDFHDAIFDNANQGRLRTRDGVIGLAVNKGFDRTELMNAIQDEELLRRVNNDIILGQEIGVISTPTYIVFGTGAPAQVFASIANMEQAFELSPIRELVRE